MRINFKVLSGSAAISIVQQLAHDNAMVAEVDGKVMAITHAAARLLPFAMVEIELTEVEAPAEEPATEDPTDAAVN